jgi:hypothetical protein
MPLIQPPWFHKQNPDFPSFTYKKPKPWLPRTGCSVPNLSVLLILNKYLQVINVSFLQTKEATPCSLKNPSERRGAPAVSDPVWILLSHDDFVRLWLMAPNIFACFLLGSSVTHYMPQTLENLKDTGQSRNKLNRAFPSQWKVWALLFPLWSVT